MIAELFEASAATQLSLAYTTGSEIHAAAFGDGVTPETACCVGSVSKIAVAYAVLGLNIDLDADVNTLLRTKRVPPLDGWQPVVTPRMLLGHVAAISDDPSDVRVWDLPNVRWRYSPVAGYDLLGSVVADVTGTAFPDAMRRLVFEPIGMSASRFDEENGPSGGLWTTATDLVRLAQAINTGHEILTPHPSEPRFGHGVFLTRGGDVDWWAHSGGGAGGYAALVASAPPFAAAAITKDAADRQVTVFEVVDALSREHGPGPLGARMLPRDSHDAWMRMTEVNAQAAGTYVLPGGGVFTLHTVPAPWDQNELVLTLPGQPAVELLRVTDGWWRVPGLESYLVFDAPDTIRLLQAGIEVRAERARE